ncbi:sialin-like isoform X1 [Pocillopora damicornis]|uniref:sialin-like isoform X1 n=1 Tax=Pocillopora damicornis TaxID=46731 RepID=UPI000F55829B|nr:sialin-like isoform X1 [Pocillopora damicornis]
MNSTEQKLHGIGGVENDKDVTQTCRCCLPLRYVIGIFLMFGFTNVYAMRVNLSVALAVMVGNQTLMKGGMEIEEPAEFSWGTKTQGFILSAFYFGYIVVHLPGGYLARKHGGATLLGLSVGATGILTLFTPLAAKTHVGVFIALRIAVGFAEGPVYPAGHAFWSKWAPPLERSKLATLNIAGGILGIIMSMFLSGYIAFHFGWSWIFYVFGSSGLIWSILCLCLVSNSPSQQRWMSREEAEYIQFSLAGDLQSQTWTASSLPYVVTLMMLILGGQIADYLRKHHLATGTVRKIFNTIGFLSEAISFLVLGYFSNATTVAVLITIGVGLGGLARSGFYVNHLDIASPLASVLLGITNTAASSAGILAPIVTGLIVQHHTSLEWRIVFFIIAAMNVLGATFFVIFGSGEKQSWAINEGYNELPKEDPDK